MTIASLADLADPRTTPRLVLKVGSALLFGQGGLPQREWLASLVAGTWLAPTSADSVRHIWPGCVS